jgi:hypothetical protein
MNYRFAPCRSTRGDVRQVPSNAQPPLAAIVAMAALLALSPLPARAVDGCQVLLCLASPNWKTVAPCVPPVQQVFKDLAKGKPFPSCSMSGTANNADHAWAKAPTFCPPQYTQVIEGKSMPTYLCSYAGAISVTVNGAPFTRTWWRFNGDTVTDFSAAAKAQLGTWDPRFDDDYATWLATQPPPPAPAP